MTMATYVYYPLFCLTWVDYTYSRSAVFIGNRLDGINNAHLRELPREPESEGVPLPPPPPHQTPNISDDGKRLAGSRQRRRRRRYAYEDHHEWPDNDYTEYDFDDELSDGESEDSLWEQIGKNWQTAGVRLVFLLCGCCCLVMVLYCCCSVWCRMCCHSIKQVCFPCGGALEYITACYQDPYYKRAKGLAEMMGLKLDYKTYMKIRDTVEGGVEEAMEGEIEGQMPF